MPLFLLGLYLSILLVISVSIAIVIMHIGEFRKYSRYLSVVLRIYLIVIIVIAIFGAYKVATGKVLAPKKNPSQTHRIDL